MSPTPKPHEAKVLVLLAKESAMSHNDYNHTRKNGGVRIRSLGDSDYVVATKRRVEGFERNLNAYLLCELTNSLSVKRLVATKGGRACLCRRSYLCEKHGRRVDSAPDTGLSIIRQGRNF
jgi:hypothetical protein